MCVRPTVAGGKSVAGGEDIEAIIYVHPVTIKHLLAIPLPCSISVKISMSSSRLQSARLDATKRKNASSVEDSAI